MNMRCSVGCFFTLNYRIIEPLSGANRRLSGVVELDFAQAFNEVSDKTFAAVDEFRKSLFFRLQAQRHATLTAHF
jgi:hypothetical protein